MQSLTRDPRRGAQYVVLRVRGELDLDTQDPFQDAVELHLASASVVVDMSAVEFLSVSALKALVAGDRAARARHHRLVFVALPRQVTRLLDLAGLDQVLEIGATASEVAGADATVVTLHFGPD